MSSVSHRYGASAYFIQKPFYMKLFFKFFRIMIMFPLFKTTDLSFHIVINNFYLHYPFNLKHNRL